MRKDESLPWGHQSLEQIVAGGHGRWVTDDTGKRVVQITGPPVGRLERLRCILRSFGQEPCEHALRLWERVNPQTWPDPRKAIPFCNNRMDEDIICTIVFDKNMVKYPLVERRISLWRSLNMEDRLGDLKRALKKNPNRERFFPHILIHVGFRTLTGDYRFVRKDAYRELSTYLGLSDVVTIQQRLWLPWNKYVSPFRQGRLPEKSQFTDPQIYDRFVFLTEIEGYRKMEVYGLLAEEIGCSQKTIRNKISKMKHRVHKRPNPKTSDIVKSFFENELLDEEWMKLDELQNITLDPNKRRELDRQKQKIGDQKRSLFCKNPPLKK